MKAAVRFRVFLFLAIYLLGFLAPWDRYLGGSHGTLWLAASTFVARSGWMTLAAATLTVTISALAFLAAGTILRLWANAAAPWGSWMFALGVSILMPLSGALFFLLAFTTIVLFLPAKRDEVYTRPRWFEAVLAEIYPIAFTLCFAVFAWRYNARILIQCLLVSYGLSLVIRAFSMRSVP